MLRRISKGVTILLLEILPGLCLSGFSADGKTTKETLASREGKRTYYLFVPRDLPSSSKVPLLLTFHGSNRDGDSLVSKWRDLAGKEGFIVAGPDAKDSSAWSAPIDGPDMVYELAEFLKSKYPIDPRRVYLFGHSAGAVFAMDLGFLESEYFAAVAIHAGAFRAETEYEVVNFAVRKIPMAIFIGDRDQFFPLRAARQTRDALLKVGFPVELNEIPNHDHWYYDMAPKINRNAWDFLKSKRLDSDPRYEQRLIQ
jgi:poly(3-hydroxybutyrate) depolymerase